MVQEGCKSANCPFKKIWECQFVLTIPSCKSTQFQAVECFPFRNQSFLCSSNTFYKASKLPHSFHVGTIALHTQTILFLQSSMFSACSHTRHIWKSKTNADRDTVCVAFLTLTGTQCQGHSIQKDMSSEIRPERKLSGGVATCHQRGPPRAALAGLVGRPGRLKLTAPRSNRLGRQHRRSPSLHFAILAIST